MPPGDDPQDAAHELRVTDRRRFNAEGDRREDGDAPEPAELPAAPAPSPRAAEAPGPAGGAPPSRADAQRDAGDDRGPRGGAHDSMHDLGIESVFLIFHQSALIALGATVPGGPPGRVDLAEARQAIAFMKVLEEKTRGNLTADEAAMLADLLSEAQMAYVQVARSMSGGGA